ncbi:MAG: hypothetical protein AVDCRST_MAG85-2153 [uncultured Solirubrobacteraceae bacterium]|uniref:Uncharacterized protein n=1 Tax=uncultured Solirubrobacteraceae bacterium TaxID=1162706 RepID=A0A6J4SXN3_9ACTN|nr:MAG: hypothetical protein AVDCRST_MAG85-2153 [uncultured Solirubrobacteraceae bacterium]
MGQEPLSEILSRPPVEALEGFLRRWHGVTSSVDRQPVRADVAPALRPVHRVGSLAPRFFAVNELLRTPRHDGDMAVFYSEEQWVWEWAVRVDDLSLDDPPVFSREVDAPGGWAQEAPGVSVFLLQLAVMNAALAPSHGAAAAWLSARDADHALAPLRELELPPWRWPGYPSRFYAGDDVVAFACPNEGGPSQDEPYRSVWVGGLDEHALSFLAPHLTAAWDMD